MASDDILGDVSTLYNDTVDLDPDSEVHYGPLVLTVAPKVCAPDFVHFKGCHSRVAWTRYATSHP